MLFTTFVGYIAGGIPGAALATVFVFLPSFVFVLGGVHYIEKVRENRALQAFLAGVSAAVVGIIAVVSLDLIPEALIDWMTVAIAGAAFLLIALLKRDVALVAVGAMVAGIIYSGRSNVCLKTGFFDCSAKMGLCRRARKTRLCNSEGASHAIRRMQRFLVHGTRHQPATHATIPVHKRRTALRSLVPSRFCSRVFSSTRVKKTDL
jgi:chromate transport protein ChrA